MSTALYQHPAWREAMRVDWPEAQHGEVSIRRITVTESEATVGSLRAMFNGGRGRIPAGNYTSLRINGRLWMSDTPDEQSDHVPFIRLAACRDTRRVLVNGLGLGMVVRALCHLDNIEHVDVVEINPDVIALVGPLVTVYGEAHGTSIDVVCGDAYAPDGHFKGLKWDVVWHDIWEEICADNWPGMVSLTRRYARRCSAQDSWCRGEVRQLVQRGRREEQGYQQLSQLLRNNLQP